MFGTSPLGTAPLGTLGGGGAFKSGSIGFTVVDRLSKTGTLGFTVLASIVHTGQMGFIVAASGLKIGSIGFTVVEPLRDNSPLYREIGNGMARATSYPRAASWSTATRPTSPTPYQEGINYQTGKKEYWNGTAWVNVDGSAT